MLMEQFADKAASQPARKLRMRIAFSTKFIPWGRVKQQANAIKSRHSLRCSPRAVTMSLNVRIFLLRSIKVGSTVVEVRQHLIYNGAVNSYSATTTRRYSRNERRCRRRRKRQLGKGNALITSVNWMKFLHTVVKWIFTRQ